MKHKNAGFTVVELMTVIVIISILVGLLLPGIAMVRNLAKTTQQKAQFTALELALEAFKNDNGQYPESKESTDYYYLGAQKLAEAMVGRDMLGFHPDTDWGEKGQDYITKYYRGLDSGFNPSNNDTDRVNLNKRKDLYLELETANVFRFESEPATDKTGLYSSSENSIGLDGDSMVLCDVYNRNKVTVYLPDNKTKMTKAGNPILYYRANLLSRDSNAGNTDERIYDARDNYGIVKVVGDVMRGRKEVTPEDLQETFYNQGGKYEKFYEFIRDPKVATGTSAMRHWPYNSKTYLLISAGRDGLYGTEDDICNFNK